MHGLEVMELERAWRKVSEVERDNDIRATMNGGGQYVAIRGVREIQALDQALVAADDAIVCVSVHEDPGSLKLFTPEIRASGKHIADPLIVDRLGPLRSIQILDGQMEKKVSERSRVEHTGVQERNETIHAQ